MTIVLDKKYYNTGVIAFLILIIISLFFYQERTIFYDSSFHLFKIIHFEKINIEAERYSTFLPQLPIIGLLKLNSSLKLIMLSLSISYILIFFIIFYICSKILNNPFVGLALILIIISNINECFYFSSTETHQALAYATLLFSLIFYNFKNQIIAIGAIIATILMAFFAHPVAFFCILFVIGYFIIEKNSLKHYSVYIYIALAILLVLYKLLTVKGDSYEGGFFRSLFLLQSWDELKFNSILSFYRNIFKLYWINIFSFFALLYILKRENRKVHFLYNAIFFFVFLVITFITYQKGDASVMMERSFMPLSFFTILPLFYELSKDVKYYRLIYISFILVFSISIIRLTYEGFYLKNQLKKLDEVIVEARNNKKHKILAKTNDLNLSPEVKRWSLPYMSLLYSTLVYKHSITINYVDNVDEFCSYIDNHEKCNIFLGPDFWREWDVKSFNKKYFNLPDCELYHLYDTR